VHSAGQQHRIAPRKQQLSRARRHCHLPLDDRHDVKTPIAPARLRSIDPPSIKHKLVAQTLAARHTGDPSAAASADRRARELKSIVPSDSAMCSCRGFPSRSTPIPIKQAIRRVARLLNLSDQTNQPRAHAPSRPLRKRNRRPPARIDAGTYRKFPPPAPAQSVSRSTPGLTPRKSCSPAPPPAPPKPRSSPGRAAPGPRPLLIVRMHLNGERLTRI